MRRTVCHISIIVLLAIILHLPFFTGWLKPIPPNFTWWAPWNDAAAVAPTKGANFDYLQEYLPWQKYLQDSIAQGELPLWNRFQFCGTPFIANHLLSPFYPPIAIGILMPYQLSAYLISFIHFLIGSIFMYFFLRRIKLDGIAALIGALVFCSSGMFTPYYPPWPAAIVWLPAVLFFVEGWLQGVSSSRSMAWLALITAFWFMEGYPIFVVHGLYFIIFYIIFVGPSGKRLSALGKFFAAVLIGAVISAVQNLPTLFFALESARFKPEVSELMEPLFSYPHLLNHLLPSQAGASKIGYHYIGLVPFLFLPFAAIKADARIKYNFFWGGVCLLLGMVPGLFVVIYRFLPLWAITPHPPVVPLFFAAAVLSAYGVQRVLKFDNPQMKNLLWAFALAAVIFLVVLIFQFKPGLNKLVLFYLLCNALLLCFILIASISNPNTKPAKLVPAGAVVVVLLLIIVPWFINFRPNRPLVELFKQPFYERYIKDFRTSNLRIYRADWQQDLPPNTGILWGIEDAGGYDSLILKKFYDEAMRNGFYFHRGREMLEFKGNQRIDSNLLEEYRIGLLLAGPQGQKPDGFGWGLYATNASGVKLYAKRDTPRAQFIPQGGFINEAVKLGYKVAGPNAIRIDAGGDKQAGYVIVRDAYAVGWRAWVDGKRVEVSPYHGWMRRVDVPAGAKEIVMRYEPVEFYIGVFISAFAFLITISWLVGGYRRKRVKTGVTAWGQSLFRLQGKVI